MKVMDADGDGVITKSELDQLKVALPVQAQATDFWKRGLKHAVNHFHPGAADLTK